jgi:hypothetical protein
MAADKAPAHDMNVMWLERTQRDGESVANLVVHLALAEVLLGFPSVISLCFAPRNAVD